MKLKFLLTITALILALCFTLAACGKQQSGGATADTATADSPKTVGDAPAVESAVSAIPQEEGSSASSAADPAPVTNNADAPKEDTPEAERHDDPQEEQSPASSAASSQTSSRSSSDNPAYQDDNKPVFTIAMTNKKTKKTYSASCSYTTDKEDVAYAAFFLPGGEYDVAVYEYTESKDRGDPLAESTYKNPVAEDKRKSIRVIYTPNDKKIEVTESTSSRTQ